MGRLNKKNGFFLDPPEGGNFLFLEDPRKKKQKGAKEGGTGEQGSRLSV